MVESTPSDRAYTWGACAVFLFGSALDTVTTYIGLSRGFQEETEFVVYLMSMFGTIPGLILAKVLAGVAVVVLALMSPHSKKMGLLLATAGGLLFTVAGIWNLFLIVG